MTRSKIFLALAFVMTLIFSAVSFSPATADANRKLLFVKSDMYKARIITGNLPSVKITFKNKHSSAPVIFQIEGFPIIGLAPEESKFVDLKGSRVYYVGLKCGSDVASAPVEINVSDGYVENGW